MRECLLSLTNQSFTNFEIKIVDNTPGQHEFNILRNFQTEFPQLQIEILKPKFNLGFAGGNNFALRKISTPFALLLNCDTELNPDCLEKVLNFLQNNPQVGMLTPKILFYMDPERIWYAGAIVNPRSIYFTKHIGINQKDRGQFDRIQETAYACGAALFVKTAVFKEIGFMDEIFFMYVEETDWNFTLNEKGYKIIYFPDAKIYHKVDIITQENQLGFRKNPFQIYLYTRNALIFAFKHFNFLDFIGYCLNYHAKTFLIEILWGISKLRFDFIYAQFRALLMGALIGFRQRFHRTCQNLMRRESHYLNSFQKESQSTK